MSIREGRAGSGEPKDRKPLRRLIQWSRTEKRMFKWKWLVLQMEQTSGLEGGGDLEKDLSRSLVQNRKGKQSEGRCFLFAYWLILFYLFIIK